MEQRLNNIQKIRAILAQHGRLPVPVEALRDSSDLHLAGLTSLARVGLMLALEDQFGIEFPDGMLGTRTFRSIEAIADAVEQLGVT
jgi:acyl carrier protein